MPKVSVIMSIYNCKNFEVLKKSVQSIINQTFTDWELIIYNDGSNDNGRTSVYIDRIKKIDSRIIVVENNENHGLAYAKNEMLAICKGEYITSQDDDDESCPERLAKEVEFLDKYLEYSFVGTAASVFSNQEIWGNYNVEKVPSKNSFLWNSPFIHPTVMFRSEVLSDVDGYRVSKETMRAEDYDLFFRLYSKGYRGYNIQKNLYLYRIENNPNIKYRTMHDRIQEARIRYKGFKELGILIRGIPYVIKPILLGVIPQKIFYLIRKGRY